MTNKWQIGWYPEPFWDDGSGGIVGKVETSDEYSESVNGICEAQVEFIVTPDLKIIIDEVHDDDDGDWTGMPKYIENQIKREAKQIFKSSNNEEFKTLFKAGEIKIKRLLSDWWE